jgi:tetratricopeptide (TPR) repeat protein
LVLVLLAAASASADATGKKHDGDAKRHRVGIGKQVAEKLLAAYELLQQEKLDEALALVDGVAKRGRLEPPEVAQIHRFRGYILVNKGMNEEAAAEFQTSLDQHALDRGAEQAMTYSLAQIYTQLGRYPRALELINTWFAAEETPKPDAYYLKAMILVQQEDFAAALEPAKTAVALSPGPRESWLQLLVAIYSQLRDYPNVAATLEQLVSIAPANKKYWVQLSAVQNFLQRDAKALATLRIADEADLLKEDAEYRQLARLLFVRELPFDCAKSVEKAVSSGAVKPDAEAYRLMSNCYIAARESDKALAPLAKAAELASDGEMYLLLGQIHLQHERFAPALDALRKALANAKPEQRGSVHLLIGVAELGSERLDDADREFHAAQADEKVRRAAESYIKFVADQRARKEQQKAARGVSEAVGVAATAPARSRLD